MRIMSVFGTRPEAIKMAPILTALAGEPAVDSILCVTGQHRQMLDQVLRLFGIVPDFDLDAMRPGQGLNALTARLLNALDPVLERVAPDRVLVHGDTTTAMAAALACWHRRIPVAHVEAGLRTPHLASPFPEEFNRRSIDLGADILFAPTARAVAALRREGAAGTIHLTGNSGIDALFAVIAMLDGDSALAAAVDRTLPTVPPERRLVLVTVHRRESVGEGLRGICGALATLAQREDVSVVFPVHRNPAICGPVHEALGGSGVQLLPPIDFVSFVRLMQRAHLILTDSGGIQEEAPALGKPVLVMREETERAEAVAAGTAHLVGTAPGPILAEAARLIAMDEQAAPPPANPFGDGHAASRIVNVLMGRPFRPFEPPALEDQPLRMRLTAASLSIR